MNQARTHPKAETGRGRQIDRRQRQAGKQRQAEAVRGSPRQAVAGKGKQTGRGREGQAGNGSGRGRARKRQAEPGRRRLTRDRGSGRQPEAGGGRPRQAEAGRGKQADRGRQRQTGRGRQAEAAAGRSRQGAVRRQKQAETGGLAWIRAQIETTNVDERALWCGFHDQVLKPAAVWDLQVVRFKYRPMPANYQLGHITSRQCLSPVNMFP